MPGACSSRDRGAGRPELTLIHRRSATLVLAEIAARADRNYTLPARLPARVLAEIAARADRNAVPAMHDQLVQVLAEIAARADRNYAAHDVKPLVRSSRDRGAGRPER